MEYKSIGQSFKDVDVKAGIVTGYFSCFGNIDSDGDVIQKGSFTRSILERGPNSAKPRIKHLMDHYLPVGTLTLLQEDDYGLYYESKAGSYPDGRNFLMYVDDKVITEHSIGFKIINSESKSDHTLITEMALWEGSSLRLWGANPNTPVTGMKSFEDIIDTLQKMQKILKSGKYTDDEMIKIEENYKSLSDFIKTTQPGSTTVPDGKKDANKIILDTFKTALGYGK